MCVCVCERERLVSNNIHPKNFYLLLCPLLIAIKIKFKQQYVEDVICL